MDHTPTLGTPPPPPAQNPLLGLGVYVHFPWCLKKCPYCDFLSIAVKSPDPTRPATRAEADAAIAHDLYATAVINEFEARLLHVVDQDHEGPPPLKSIFFGGGTPSLWQPRALGRVVRHIIDRFAELEKLGGELEITVECNPTSVDEEHFRALIQAGVNRVSIGVQGLEESRLGFLGRLHDPQQALGAVDMALRAGVPRVSADLIYGVYRQSSSMAVHEVTSVAQRGVEHVSAYMLTIEENTRFGALHAQKKLPLLDDSIVADSYEQVRQALRSMNFEHYEVSNFALPGARSTHNMGYWLGRDYLGLGTGAYGTVTIKSQPGSIGQRLRYRNIISPERYLEHWASQDRVAPAERSVSSFVGGVIEEEWIDADMAMDEALMLGLRMRDGVDVEAVARVRGHSKKHDARAPTIKRLVNSGKLLARGSTLQLPHDQWLFTDSILRELL